MSRAAQRRADDATARRNATRSGLRGALDLNRSRTDGPGDEVRKFSSDPRQATEILKRAGYDPVPRTFPDGSEHLVIGVVMEPVAEPDTQGDVISAPEIAAAESAWRSEYGAIGLQHASDISDSVEIVQSWIAPCDLQIGGGTAVAGSWCLAVRVLDDVLWAACRNGSVTGYSIGGTANRQPVA